MLSTDIKKIAKNIGADICGIAPICRFNDAPRGFHPTDIYKDCKSVVVLAKRLPKGSLMADNLIPYTFANGIITQQVDNLTFNLSVYLEKFDMTAVPIPSDDPYLHWDQKHSYGRAILSMRHAGYLAGLGILGKNTLLMNKKFGNMIQLGAVLIDKELEGDPVANYAHCPPSCNLCIENCPTNALDGTTVNQKKCRPLSVFTTEKGYVIKKCNICRKICPNSLGIEK